MAIYTELPIYKHGCDLLSLALDVQVQMPRMFKRSLGEKIHAKCVDMLEAMAKPPTRNIFAGEYKPAPAPPIRAGASDCLSVKSHGIQT